ncbi:hypothetical protein M405DRAFT_864231, partial [Rhizopogon salebrosus TDB-379]
ALLVAGGSGIAFTLGILDDIVGRCIRLERSQGERTRKPEPAWCIRSFGQIEWFASMLIDIASIDLHISIYVTCLCDPEAVPAIPNSIVVPSRPLVHDLLATFINPPVKRKTIETATKCRSGKILAEESQFALVARRA